jgi:hypothetical protein
MRSCSARGLIVSFSPMMTAMGEVSIAIPARVSGRPAIARWAHATVDRGARSSAPSTRSTMSGRVARVVAPDLLSGPKRQSSPHGRLATRFRHEAVAQYGREGPRK